MSHELHRIIYVSLICPEMRDTLPQTLEGVLAESRAWNADHAITGLLLYGNGRFGQVLEGPRQEVEGIFEKIRTDRRHHQLIKLDYRTLEQRLFPHWAMAALPFDGMAGRSNSDVLKDFDLKRMTDDLALRALRDVLVDGGA